MLLLALLISAEAPPTVRLPEGVKPTHYAADLTVDPNADKLTGVLDIDLEVAKETPVLWLNATEITIAKSATQKSGMSRKKNPTPPTQSPTKWAAGPWRASVASTMCPFLWDSLWRKPVEPLSKTLVAPTAKRICPVDAVHYNAGSTR